MRLDRLWVLRRLWAPEGAAGGGGDGGAGGGEGGAGGGGNGEGGGGAGGGSGGGGGEGGAPAHWGAALPEDLRSHEFVKGSKDLADFTKQAVNAQGLLGRKGAIVPKDDAAPEEWDKFYETTGRPKAHTDYKVPERPDKQPFSDSDKAFQGAMLPVLHKAGLTQRQVDTVAGAFNEYGVKLEGVFKEFADKSSAALDKDWGAERPAKIASGKRFAEAVLGSDYENLKRLPLVGGGYVADHPLILKLLAGAGDAMGEDGGAGGGGGGGSDPMSSPEAAKAYVDEVYATAEKDKSHWLHDPNSAEYKRQKEYLHKVQRLANKPKAAAD